MQINNATVKWDDEIISPDSILRLKPDAVNPDAFALEGIKWDDDPVPPESTGDISSRIASDKRFGRVSINEMTGSTPEELFKKYPAVENIKWDEEANIPLKTEEPAEMRVQIPQGTTQPQITKEEESWPKVIGKSVVGGLGRIGTGLMGAAQAITETGEAGTIPYIDELSKEVSDFWTPKVGENTAKKYAAAIAGSIATSLPLMLTGPAALPLFGLTSGGSKYQQLRAKGIEPEKAALAAVPVGVSEALTEIPVMKAAFNPVTKNILKRAMNVIWKEMPGEQVNTIVESVVDKLTIRPNMTFKDYLKDAFDTAVVTIGQAGVTGAVMHPIVKQVQAQQEQQNIEDTINRMSPEIQTMYFSRTAHYINKDMDKATAIRTAFMDTMKTQQGQIDAVRIDAERRAEQESARIQEEERLRAEEQKRIEEQTKDLQQAEEEAVGLPEAIVSPVEEITTEQPLETSQEEFSQAMALMRKFPDMSLSEALDTMRVSEAAIQSREDEQAQAEEAARQAKERSGLEESVRQLQETWKPSKRPVFPPQKAQTAQRERAAKTLPVKLSEAVNKPNQPDAAIEQGKVETSPPAPVETVIDKATGGEVGFTTTFTQGAYGSDNLVTVKDAKGNIIGQRDPFHNVGIPVNEKIKLNKIRNTARDIISEYQQKAMTAPVAGKVETSPKPLYHYTDTEIKGDILKRGKYHEQNYFGDAVYLTEKNQFPGKFGYKAALPENLKILDLTSDAAYEKFRDDLSREINYLIERSGQSLYDDLRATASKMADYGNDKKQSAVIRKAVDKLTKDYDAIKSPYFGATPEQNSFEMVVKKDVPIKPAVEEAWQMTREELKNWDFPVPTGGGSKTPKTVFSWKREDYETLHDIATQADDFRFKEALGKGWSDWKTSLYLADKIKRNEPITIYRASEEGKIIPGSYVSESIEYVKGHQENILKDKGQIEKMIVKPSELMTYGDPHEFIYIPDSVESYHKKVIQQALSEGKQVPAEVLKDYPDLMQKPVKKDITEQPEPVMKEQHQETLGKKAEELTPDSTTDEADKASKEILSGEEGFLAVGNIAEGISKITPFEAERLEAAGLHVKDAIKFSRGEKGLFGKLYSIPYWVGNKWPSFGKVFNAIQETLDEFNEIIYNAKEAFDKKTYDIIRKNDKLAEIVYEGMERNAERYTPSLDGLVNAGIITEAEAAAYEKIAEQMPIASRQTGMTVKEIEHMDKNVYEGLMHIAAVLGIKHHRVINAGRGRLGFSRKDRADITTQYATELSVLAHEIGHQLDRQFNLWDKIVDSAEGVGKKGKVTESATKQIKAKIQKELRDLADLTWEGYDPDAVSKSYKAKVRKKAEKMAHILEAYVHAPARLKEVAPNVYEAFQKFVEDTPQLESLPGIKQGLSLMSNNLYRSGRPSRILRDMVESKNITEDQALKFVTALDKLSDWKETRQELIDMGIPDNEIVSKTGKGKKWSARELRGKGITEKEIQAYNDMYMASEDFGTKYQIEAKKWNYGFYKEGMSEIEKRLLEVQVRNAMKHYGAYLPLMRFGDYFIAYKNPEGIREVTSFDSLTEALKFQKSLGDEASPEIVDIKDEKKRKSLYPHLSIHQLDQLLEAAEVSKNDAEIRELRETILARMGDVRSIRRQWVPGYLRTGDNLAKTVENYLDHSVRRYTKAKSNALASKAVQEIDNPALKEYALRYLDAFNTAADDAVAFKAMRTFAQMWYLAGKLSYGVLNLSSQLTTTWPRLVKDAGIFSAVRIWTEARTKTMQYHAYRMALMAGKDFSAGIDPELTGLLDKLERQNVIQGTFTNELLDLREGIETMEGGKLVWEKAKEVGGIIGTMTEKDNRIQAAIAGYLAAKNKGLEPLSVMKDYIRGTQWQYGRQNVPVKMNEFDKVARGGGKTAWLFQSWVHNYLQMLSSYGRGALHGQEKAANAKAFIASLGTMGALTGIKGLPFVALIAAIWTLITGDAPDEEFRKALGPENRRIADTFLYGRASVMTGVDISSLAGVGRFPGLNYERLAKTGEIDPDTAIGGLWDRMRRGKEFKDRQQYGKMLSEFAPDALRNYLKGTEMEEEGIARTVRGEALTLGGKTLKVTPEEADMRKMGFPPLKVSKAYEEMGHAQLLRRRITDRQDRYYDMLSAAIAGGDKERENKIRNEIAGFNSSAQRHERIIIDWQTLRNRVKAIRNGRDYKTFPKRMRPELHRRQELYGETGG